MKLNTETKVGLLAIIALAMFILGFNFMKNIQLFGKSFEVKSYFDNVDGLITGNPVVLNGKRVGQVRSVEMNKETGRIEVAFSVEKGLRIPVDSKAIIASDLFGSKTIRLERGTSKTLIETGATIEGVREQTLTERVMNEILPLKDNISKLLSQMEQFVGWMNNTMDESTSNKIDDILDDLRLTASSTRQITGSVNNLISSVGTGVDYANKIILNLKNQNEVLNRMMGNMAMFTDSLAYSSTNVRTMIRETSEAITNLTDILGKVKSGDNSIGRLLTDTTFYTHLDQTITQVDSFLKVVQVKGVDLHHHIHLGGGPKEKKEKKKESQ